MMNFKYSTKIFLLSLAIQATCNMSAGTFQFPPEISPVPLTWLQQNYSDAANHLYAAVVVPQSGNNHHKVHAVINTFPWFATSALGSLVTAACLYGARASSRRMFSIPLILGGLYSLHQTCVSFSDLWNITQKYPYRIDANLPQQDFTFIHKVYPCVRRFFRVSKASCDLSQHRQTPVRTIETYVSKKPLNNGSALTSQSLSPLAQYNREKLSYELSKSPYATLINAKYNNTPFTMYVPLCQGRVALHNLYRCAQAQNDEIAKAGVHSNNFRYGCCPNPETPSAIHGASEASDRLLNRTAFLYMYFERSSSMIY